MKSIYKLVVFEKCNSVVAINQKRVIIVRDSKWVSKALTLTAPTPQGYRNLHTSCETVCLPGWHLSPLFRCYCVLIRDDGLLCLVSIRSLQSGLNEPTFTDLGVWLCNEKQTSFSVSISIFVIPECSQEMQLTDFSLTPGAQWRLQVCHGQSSRQFGIQRLRQTRWSETSNALMCPAARAEQERAGEILLWLKCWRFHLSLFPASYLIWIICIDQ